MSGRIVYVIKASLWPREVDEGWDYIVTALRFRLPWWQRKTPRAPGTWFFEEGLTHSRMWRAGRSEHVTDIQVKYDAAQLEAEQWVEEFKQRDCDESRVSAHYRKEITGDCSTP